ncbi:MAG: hypothetical protein IPM48_00380 [Saprospiraceae bacterium]|nr:hypothetical protein [Saprospiraceae bacterium]
MPSAFPRTEYDFMSSEIDAFGNIPEQWLKASVTAQSQCLLCLTLKDDTAQ